MSRLDKCTWRLTPAQFEAFAGALEGAKHPADKLRLLMREPVIEWNESTEEPIPEDMQALLDKLK